MINERRKRQGNIIEKISVRSLAPGVKSGMGQDGLRSECKRQFEKDETCAPIC